MATQERHPEWRDYLESTNYPFADLATLSNDAGDFIGESVFLDALFYPVGAADRMYLSQVVVTNDRVTLWIGDSNVQQLASTEFDVLSSPDNLQFLDSAGRPAGIIVSEANRLATFQSWSVGSHLFSPSQTEFVARVCAPTPEVGVRGIRLEDGSLFTEDVWIVGDDGVVVSRSLSESPVEGFTPATIVEEGIRVDIVGDPLFRRRLCSGVFVSPTFLKTITFRHGCESVVCGPDELGDLKINVGSKNVTDTILRIRSVPEGLTFEAVGEQLEG